MFKWYVLKEWFITYEIPNDIAEFVMCIHGSLREYIYYTLLVRIVECVNK